MDTCLVKEITHINSTTLNKQIAKIPIFHQLAE